MKGYKFFRLFFRLSSRFVFSFSKNCKPISGQETLKVCFNFRSEDESNFARLQHIFFKTQLIVFRLIWLDMWKLRL